MIRSIVVVIICVIAFVPAENSVQNPILASEGPRHRRRVIPWSKALGQGLLYGVGVAGGTQNLIRNGIHENGDAESPENENNSKYYTGGCKWFGTAPFCKGACPRNYAFVRSDDGQCADKENGRCQSNSEFGHVCWFGKKNYCCRHSQNDCSLDGYWVNSNSAKTYFCKFHHVVQKTENCGALKCMSISPPLDMVQVNIIGEYCDIMHRFGKVGHITCGMMAFPGEYDSSTYWYKTTATFDEL